LAYQTRDEGNLGIIFLDLDDFKMINDSLGHAAGDKVLKEVGRRLSLCVRPMDTVARFGGDEFAVLVEDARKPEDIGEVAERILTSLNEPILIGDKEVFTHASLGIAAIEGEDALVSGADDLIRNADLAMYMAKRDGKGQYRLFEPHMHANLLERLETKGALQKALDRGELTLRYQPIVELSTQNVIGFETLVRWEHPERGEISPTEFIPLAEETGLIIPLGEFVLREACRQGKFLQDMAPNDPPLTISVNVSVKQLQQADFTQKVAQVLEETSFDPSRLMLEITESLLMIDTEATIHKLHELKQLGVQLAVDDFGTGYSSLSYLSRFPVDALKIDRSFVSNVDGGDQDSALAEAIVRLGETLRLKTVAEGVELQEQMDRFLELGCQLGQGFYVAKPLPIDEALEFLQSGLPEEVGPEKAAG
jgi:diguanylate cyclase (GGDEF)-like protein